MINPYFQFSCETATGCFSLVSLKQAALQIHHAGLEARARVGRQTLTVLRDGLQKAQSETRTGAHGTMQTLELRSSNETGLTARIIFALPEAHPLFLWRVCLENNGQLPLQVERITMLQCGGRFSRSQLAAGTGRLAFFAQGWQSWNHTAAFGAEQAQRRSRLNFLEAPMYVNPGTPQTHGAGHYSADFYGVVGSRRNRLGWLAGFLAQREQFGSLEAWLDDDSPALAMWANGDDVVLEPGAALQTDWAVLMPVNVDEPDPLGDYLDAVARENQIPAMREIPAGWCSWYYLYQKVTANDVRRNLANVQQMSSSLPLKMIQIDDGYQAQIGDWLTPKPAFSEGMDKLADEIRSAGMLPGLWLAPFLVHPKSALYREHPQWLLRDKNGRPVYSLFNWNARMTALDPTHPGALEYITRVIETVVHRWGYGYLKLDFLYAGGLRGKYYNPCLTRAQVLFRGMQAIRNAAGLETMILGCGMPLGSGLGLVDALRVGADTEGSWTPRPYGIKKLLDAEPNLPALRNAMQNPLTRADLHSRWWVNDPDCLLVRPTTDLTVAEVRAQAALIAMTGGALLLSDDLPTLPADRRRMVEVLLPLIGQRPRVLDWFDRETPRRLRLDLNGAVGEWSLLAWFNMDDKPVDFDLRVEDFGLRAGAYWAREFWQADTRQVEHGAETRFGQVPAHGVVLAAVRARTASQPQYLGSNLHISQGLEVSGWRVDADEMRLRLALPRRAEGYVEFYLPTAPLRAWLDGAETVPADQGGGRYRVMVALEQSAELRVAMKK